MTKQYVVNYLRQNKEAFRQKYAVEQIGLFGSYARDEATQESDVDIFVQMKPDLFGMIGLKREIEKDLLRSVDLIRDHKNIRPSLRQMIQQDITYV
jgi:predicted nucleotidyltransferase